MSDKLKKLQIKKLIQEYNYLQSEFEYKNAIIEENKPNFIQEVSNLLGDEFFNKEIESSNTTNIVLNKNNDQPINLTLENSEIKKLYRLITKKTHPDYDKNGDYIKEYMLAVDAYQKKDDVTIYVLAHNLNIDYEISENDLIKFKEKILFLKKEIVKIETTYIYVWSQIVDLNLKNKLILTFINNKK